MLNNQKIRLAIGLVVIIAVGLGLLINHIDNRNGYPGAAVSVIIIFLPLLSPFLHMKDFLFSDTFESSVSIPVISNLLVPSVDQHMDLPSPDYSIPEAWAAAYNAKDPADIHVKNPIHPRANEKEEPFQNQDNNKADCFFLPPTTFYNSKYWNSPWNDSFAVYIHDEAILTQQASIFNHAARIYSPRYRQMTGFAYFTPESKKHRAIEAADLAYSDIKRAFEYYLENWNKDRSRPIILAGHSQGAEYVLRLVRDYFQKGMPLHKNLIAAYAVGMPVYQKYLDEWKIKACSHPKDVNCIISWQSYIQGSDPDLFYYDPIDPTLKKPAGKKPEKVCVNPLSWLSGNTKFVPKEKNLGAMHLVQYYQNIAYLAPQIEGTFKEKQLERLSTSLLPLTPGLVGGECIDGSFFVSNPPYYQVDDWVHLFLPLWRTFHFPGSNLHPYDYNLVYENVRRNAIERVEAYFQ